MQDLIYIAVVFGFFALCLAGVGFFGSELEREGSHGEKE